MSEYLFDIDELWPRPGGWAFPEFPPPTEIEEADRFVEATEKSREQQMTFDFMEDAS